MGGFFLGGWPPSWRDAPLLCGTPLSWWEAPFLSGSPPSWWEAPFLVGGPGQGSWGPALDPALTLLKY